MRASSSQKLKFAIFCLVPTVALLLGAEVAVRVAGLAAPALRTIPLPEEIPGLIQPDEDLFWSLKPGAAALFEGAPVLINSRGLRGPEIGPKARGEYRILSLGESTTFGVGVADSETYSAVLERLLGEAMPGRRVVVVNAGVSAYSSFQIARYLELRGLALAPDLVLVYSELNDYLPSTMRDSSNTEIGLLKTDKQLYESRVQRAYRFGLRWSALFRWLNYRLSQHRIRSFDRTRIDNPFQSIGLPDIGLLPRVFKTQGSELQPSGLNEKSLGRRVSDAERLENLRKLDTLCKSGRIDLVFLHPSYANTVAHECLLTRFCRDSGRLLFETLPSLHPEGAGQTQFYLDTWHPTREGHRRLAEDLARFVLDKVLARTGVPATAPAHP